MEGRCPIVKHLSVKQNEIKEVTQEDQTLTEDFQVDCMCNRTDLKNMQKELYIQYFLDKTLGLELMPGFPCTDTYISRYVNKTLKEFVFVLN